MRLVLDTNIVMDMLHFDDRHTHALRMALNHGHMTCFTDSECLAELEKVSRYPEFGLDLPARNALIEGYRGIATLCDASGVEDYLLPRCRDRDDQKFLVLAARSKADLLITRDKMLLKLVRNRRNPPPCPIVTAETAETLLQLAPENPAGFV
jgi:putative PIN family toxin of toxin-antitoxin system